MLEEYNVSKEIVNQLSIGWAQHKIVYDEDNNPVNYIFIDLNDQFEKITGLKRENLIDKKITNVFNDNNGNSNDTDENSLDWIEFYNEISLNKENNYLKKYSEQSEKWYKVKVFSVKKGYFTTIFHDITKRKRKEQEDKKEKEKIAKFFNKMNDVVWSISFPELEVEFISKSIENIIGYSKKEFKENDRLFFDIIHPDDKEIDKRSLEKLKNEGYAERELRIITKSGKVKWTHSKDNMVYDKDNNPIRIQGVMREITQRKKLEKNLKEKNVLLNSILESIQDGISVLNPDLTIRYTNSKMDEWFKDNKVLKNTKCYKGFYDKQEKCKDCPVVKSLESEKMEREIKKLSDKFDIDYLEIFAYPIFDDSGNEITGIVEFVCDISRQVKRREELEMMNFSINKADLLIFRVSPEGIVEYANERVLDKLNYKKDEIIGIEVKDLLEIETFIERKEFWSKIKKLGSINYERKFKTKDGVNVFPVEIKSQYFKYDKKEYEIAFVQDITVRKEKEKEINYLLNKDSLTDIYNRRYFEEELKRLDTNRQLPLSIIMGDLNGLKMINDTYGNTKGNKVLSETASKLKNIVRDEDILARHGGDEFSILLPKTSYEIAQKVVNRINSEMNNFKVDNIPVSLSLGIASKTEINEDINEVLKKADDNMYSNKLTESRSAKHKMVQNLLNTLGAKSSETKEHSIRMTNLAYKLGDKIGLSNSDLNGLSLIATLHDIGKTTISEDILKKPGKLTNEEWEIIKEHPERGYKIASATEEFAAVAEEILSHHERWDGKGYPRGLKGEDIPYLARIISIIDAYDVMTSERPYSDVMSKEEALEEIKDCAGSQFDPELAKEFIELQKNNK